MLLLCMDTFLDFLPWVLIIVFYAVIFFGGLYLFALLLRRLLRR